jgi:hypothetical protein
LLPENYEGKVKIAAFSQTDQYFNMERLRSAAAAGTDRVQELSPGRKGKLAPAQKISTKAREKHRKHLKG